MTTRQKELKATSMVEIKNARRVIDAGPDGKNETAEEARIQTT